LLHLIGGVSKESAAVFLSDVAFGMRFNAVHLHDSDCVLKAIFDTIVHKKMHIIPLCVAIIGKQSLSQNSKIY
jgi:hypothetical protein